MDPVLAIAIWLAILIVSMAVVVFFSHRWGHDPFGWALLGAAMGPIAIVALIGTRQRDQAASNSTATSVSGSGSYVIASDGSDAGRRIAQHLAQDPQPSHQVTVLTVLPHEMAGDEEAAAAEARRRSSEPAAILGDAGWDVMLETRFGAAGEEIVRFADQIDASMILIGRRGAGLTRALMGSVSNYVVGHTTRPVMVVS
jgi:nucleotide-binding universal stress UspA family protein